MEQEWKDVRFSVQTLENNPERSCLLSIMADTLQCVFCCLALACLPQLICSSFCLIQQLLHKQANGVL